MACMHKLDYMPRLDGVRALAVVGVLITHFMWQFPGVADAQLGRIGVRVFFVLSGFLITRILLDYRERMSVGAAAKTFYIRRALRLLPALYFAVIVSLILGIANMREDWLIHVLYLSNFLLAVRGEVEPIGHLWSLAVEEQFYIAWFAVVVWLPRRWLLPMIMATLLVSPVFRYVSADWPGRPAALTPAVTDCLAFGALIGVASLENERLFRLFANWWSLALTSAALVALIVLFPDPVPLGTAMGLFGASLVAIAAVPETRGLDWLSVGPLRELGKISYGIYLYHMFLPPLFRHLGIEFPNYQYKAAVLIPMSIAVAAASWVLIERPALSLKRFYRGSEEALRTQPV